MTFRDEHGARNATPGLIETLWEAIQRTPQRQTPYVPRYSEEAFVPMHRLEDWLFGVGIMGNYHVVSELLWLNHIPLLDYVHHPGRTGDSVMVLQGVSLAGATAFLLSLENYGLPIAPDAWINAILSKMPTRRNTLIEYAQLRILWHPRERRKQDIDLQVENYRGPATTTEFRTPHGYRAEFLTTPSGDPVGLCVTGPKYRSRSRPQLRHEKCKVCGLEYMKGLRSDGVFHRREHKKVVAVLEPGPDPRLTPDSLREVTAASPRWEHRLMYDRARQFRREMGFDFSQWGNPDRDPKAKGYLFVDAAGVATGCCAFRWREWTDAPPEWSMQFVWIAPCYRRRGILTRHWPTFRECFGDFHVESPLSDAMHAFLAKQSAAVSVPETINPQE